MASVGEVLTCVVKPRKVLQIVADPFLDLWPWFLSPLEPADRRPLTSGTSGKVEALVESSFGGGNLLSRNI